jgi:putative ABC transport system permease protein
MSPMPPAVPRWVRRLVLLFRRDAAERSMDAELRYHIECETAERVRTGMAPEEARRQAMRDFGSVEAVKEYARDARGLRPLEDLVFDLRYAVRTLRRSAALTSAMVLTFALGIGAASAIFSVAYGILMRPLPYANSERLVVLWERNVPRNRDQNVVSVDNFEAWRDGAQAFDAMAALVPRAVTLAAGGSPERVVGAEVSPGYFDLLGVAPARGREFAPADARSGAAGVVILSDGLWRRRFGGDPAVVGRALSVGGQPHTIVGVMPNIEPPRFGWLGEQQLWFPFVPSAENRAWGRFLLVVARLRAGTTLDAARAEMATIAERRSREAAANREWGVTVTPLAQQITGAVRAPLIVVLCAVGLLLLMAVVNVATLMLSLTRRRGQELAMRRALGATDGRLFRQLFAQSAVVGVFGGCAGLLVAVPGVRALTGLLPADVPRMDAIRLDAPVLFAASLIAVAATLAFGSVAAVRGRSSRAVAGPAANGIAYTRVRARAGGGTLVAVEVALGLALSLMALLMMRSFVALRGVDLGFSPDGVTLARLALPGDRYRSPASQRAFFAALLERVRALPGVDSAGIISARPFGGLGPATTVRDAREPLAPGALPPVTDIRFADAGFFRTLRMPTTRGVLFEGGNLAGPPEAVINESLAEAVWPGLDPVGRDLAIEINGGTTARIVGVVADHHLMDVRTPVRPAAYLLEPRYPDVQRDLVVRSSLPEEALVSSLRAAVAELEPSLPLYQLTTMSQLVDRSLAGDRFTTALLGAFALVALMLAAVGIFGVFSADVTERRREIGVRVALGAGSWRVVTLLLRRALTRAVAGIIAGAFVALLLARFMTSLLFGVRPADPGSFAAVAVLLLAIAAGATLIPAIKALRSSPLDVLRTD